MRFRKRISLTKGLRVNISKQGFSMTAGIPGLSVNFGRKGTYVNTGVPGTGFYDRRKIGSRRKTGQQTASRVRSNESSRTPSAERTLFLSAALDSRGKAAVVDSEGNEIEDPALIRRIKRKEPFKEKVRELSRQFYAEKQKEAAAWLQLHKQTPELLPADSWKKQLDSLEESVFRPRPFSLPEPAEEEVRSELAAEAKLQIRPWAFWRRKMLRRRYVEERLPDELSRRREQWYRELEEHKAEQEQLRRQFEAGEKQRVENERMQLLLTIEGDPTFLEPLIEEELKRLDVPFPFEIDLDLTEDGSIAAADIDLPDIEEMPSREFRLNAYGRISSRALTETKRRKQYAAAVSGLMLAAAGTMLNISPKIEHVILSGYTHAADPVTGKTYESYILSADFDRRLFQEIDVSRVDPAAAVLHHFRSRSSFSKRWIAREIEPLAAADILHEYPAD